MVETIKRHENIWFDDGNVVLDASGTTLFRVHKGVLGKQSSFFKDMFALPPVPANVHDHGGVEYRSPGADMYDGVPVVKMAGDKEKDVEWLLRFLYEPRFYGFDNDPSHDMIISLLRLFLKYDFAGIQQSIISYLRGLFPHKFADIRQVLVTLSNSCLHTDSLMQILGMVRRLEPKSDIIAPFIFFVCCVDDVEVVMKAATRYLLPEDIVRLMVGRERLSNRMLISPQADDNPREWNRYCHAKQCSLQDVQKVWTRNMIDWIKTNKQQLCGHLLRLGGSVLTGLIVPNQICQYCAAEIIKLYDQRRARLWEQLPSFFGFCKSGEEEAWYKAALEHCTSVSI